MAWGVKLYTVGFRPAREFELSWWTARDLLSDPRMREIPDGLWGGDLVGVLSVKEVLALDDQFAERVHKHQRKDRKAMRTFLELPSSDSLIAVWIFDWSSGM